jgi:hypothetical protein
VLASITATTTVSDNMMESVITSFTERGHINDMINIIFTSLTSNGCLSIVIVRLCWTYFVIVLVSELEMTHSSKIASTCDGSSFLSQKCRRENLPVLV